jgi:hypothetical protein
VIYLLIVEEEDLFLLFYRDKNDPVGKNASMSNKAFRTALSKNLEILEADVRSGDVEELLSTSPSSQSGEAKS